MDGCRARTITNSFWSSSQDMLLMVSRLITSPKMQVVLLGIDFKRYLDLRSKSSCLVQQSILVNARSLVSTSNDFLP